MNEKQEKMYLEDKEILHQYIKEKKLKNSEQRFLILEEFLKSGKHLCVEELYELVKANDPGIGIATIYRTLRLFCQCGICQELKFDDGISRFEHFHGKKHHDHLICENCGKLIEVFDPEIEKMQEKLASKNDFTISHHKLEIYGLCSDCNK